MLELELELELELAPAKENIIYHFAKTEELPFDNETLDLIFVASSLHWFDYRKFFKKVTLV